MSIETRSRRLPRLCTEVVVQLQSERVCPVLVWWLRRKQKPV
ncbi:unnamed protein product [Staurois parvus]|uniref:Uncharacterized protein n=1 Tax=Staurois parvus TaxID=386267 RepID=A0ABN9EW54_9NEOB|nr:unnamed protein product [Staurois parvus]